MKLLYTILFAYYVGGVSCHNPEKPQTKQLNDTTKILYLSIREGISLRSMPSAGELFRNYPYYDTIFITSDSLPLNILPKSIDSIKLQIFSKEVICKAISSYSYFSKKPFYLNLMSLQKNDTGYFVLMECTNCEEYRSGGVLGLWFKAVKDSFLLIDKTAASTN